MINVTEKHLRIILDILNKYVPDCEIRAFGSRFIGNEKEYSDLDLAIVGKEKLDLNVFADLKEAMEESDLPYRVDLLDWNSISQQFRRTIEKRGFEVILNGAEKSSQQRNQNGLDLQTHEDVHD
jgi:predicted nucleotidyltransferase